MADNKEPIRAEHWLTTGDNPNHAKQLNDLGVKYYGRYKDTGVVADLKESIRLARQAIDLTPKDHPALAERLTNLGNGLADKYLSDGIESDLDESILLAQRAIDLTLEDNPDLAEWLCHLGDKLSSRYVRTGAFADIEEAMRATRHAVHLTPEGHPETAVRLNCLANRILDKYGRTGDEGELEEAIQFMQQAVDLIPEGDPNLPLYLNNLGVGFSDRYESTLNVVDIEEAIRMAQKAVDLMPRGHPDLPGSLSNLGNYLREKYLSTEATSDLEKAIRVMKEGIDLTPEGHLDLAGQLNNLGLGYSARYTKSSAIADLEGSTLSYRSALHQLNSPILFRINSGQELLRLHAVQLDWFQAYKAAETTISLLPKLTSRSVENYDIQHRVAEIVGLASDGAAAALNAEQGPFVALNLLEQGRGVLSLSLEDMRADIQELQETHRELAEQYISLRNELDLNIEKGHTSSWNQRYDKGNKLDQLLVDIRSRPGFEEFLLLPSEEEIYAAARQGPIVLINVSGYRCDAILIEQHRIRCLPLTGLYKDDILVKVGEGSPGNTETLEWLWDTVACPILDALDIKQPPPDEAWPHIWWIPTGPLSEFPLHAAGHHSKGYSTAVLDRVMSSYSPSIRALIYARRRGRKVTTVEPGLALLVSMENTPRQSKLPFAAKEVAMVHNLHKSMALKPIEPGRRYEDIVPHLAYCKIFHFAGHGYTHEDDPLKSELLLEGRESNPLTVSTLLKMNLRQNPPFLAYLSACGTGRNRDERLLDESIHLISACQLAGFRHVIGTLWEVSDELCVDMARITYEGIRDGGMTDKSVCQGLHNASRELRNRWLHLSSVARGKNSTKEEGTTMKDGAAAAMASSPDDRGKRLARDMILDDEKLPEAHWIPYIHIGA